MAKKKDFTSELLHKGCNGSIVAVAFKGKVSFACSKCLVKWQLNAPSAPDTPPDWVACSEVEGLETARKSVSKKGVVKVVEA
jgi:hypothetical protein